MKVLSKTTNSDRHDKKAKKRNRQDRKQGKFPALLLPFVKRNRN